MRILRFFFVSAGLLSLAPQSPAASRWSEPILPGGVSPRDDIVWWETFDGLPTPDESASQDFLRRVTNLSFVTGDSWYLTQEPEFAAVGDGCMSASPPAGGTGAGFAGKEGLSALGAASLRFYVKFGETYTAYHACHGPSLNLIGTSGGYRHVTIELSPIQPWLSLPSPQWPHSFRLDCNRAVNTPLRNGRWHCIELQVRLETQASVPAGTPESGLPYTGNGELRLWVDDVLAAEYTNLNYGAVSNSFAIREVWGPREYYHALVPRIGHDIHFDNFVVSSGKRVGPAATVRPQVAGDPHSPYQNLIGIWPNHGRNPANDCEGVGQPPIHSALLGVPGSVSEVVSPIHDGFPHVCLGAAPDQAMQVTVKGPPGYGGRQWYYAETQLAAGGTFASPQYVLNGWLWLPPGQDYAAAPALCGFRRYSHGTIATDQNDTARIGRYVALALNSAGRFAIKQRRDGSHEGELVLESAESPLAGVWQEFELVLWRDQKCSLMIDRTRLFDRASLPYPVEALFSGDAGAVFGILDHQGPTPLTVFYDDFSAGSVSRWSGDGWNPAINPFGNVGTRPEIQVVSVAPGQALNLAYRTASPDRRWGIEYSTELRTWRSAAEVFRIQQIGQRHEQGQLRRLLALRLIPGSPVSPWVFLRVVEE